MHTYTYRSILFSYEILTPAALNFFVDYSSGAVESLWSIDQYFEFVLVLMLSTGLAFQVRSGEGCACVAHRGKRLHVVFVCSRSRMAIGVVWGVNGSVHTL
jgi:hypothetical protein